MERSLGQQMIRTAGIFQAITALPTMLSMGERAWEALYYPYINVYSFITAACTGLMAAGVLFIILVQRHPKNTKTSNYWLEIAKSGLSTALWLWLFFDSIFGPYHGYYSEPDTWRKRKIIQASLCFIVLPVLFYPTLAFAVYDLKYAEGTPADEEEAGNEREPLLRGPAT